MKIKSTDIIFILTGGLLCMYIDWDWNSAKAFISGGLIVSWVMVRFF